VPDVAVRLAGRTWRITSSLERHEAASGSLLASSRGGHSELAVRQDGHQCTFGNGLTG